MGNACLCGLQAAGYCERHNQNKTDRQVSRCITDPVYRETYDRDRIRKKTLRVTPCLHRGEQLPDKALGCGCTLFACSIHDRCTNSGNAAGVTVCLHCDDYQSQGTITPTMSVESLMELIDGDTVPNWPHNWEKWPVSIEAMRRCVARQVERIRSNPPPLSGEGRGIVTLGGGYKYFIGSIVLLSVLRELDCKLPVEVYYLGRHEMDERMIELVRERGGEPIDLLERLRERGFKPRVVAGWPAKIWAIIVSQFREVMFLDADQVPAVDPTYLFDADEYAATGAVFWPDQFPSGWDITPEAFGVCGLAVPGKTRLPTWNQPTDYIPFESGQLMIDKRRQSVAVELCRYINDHADFWYPAPKAGEKKYWHIYGDKSTFYLAWHAIDAPFAIAPPTRWVGGERGADTGAGAFLQHDFQGRVVFQHRCSPTWKYTVNGVNPRADIVHNEKIHYAIHWLRQRWSGRVHDVATMTDRDRVRFAEQSGHWIRRRWDDPLGRIVLRDDGGIGRGAPEETHWRIFGDELLICGKQGVYRVLTQDPRNGRWINKAGDYELIHAPPEGWATLAKPEELAVYADVVRRNEYRLPADLSGWSVLDIGAHVGSFSHAVGIRKASQLVAVEACPANAGRYLENVKHMATKPTLLVGAVAYDSMVGMIDREGHSGSWGDRTKVAKSPAAAYFIQSLDLDRVVGTTRFDLIKIDCEGCEFDFFRWLRKSDYLERFAPLLVGEFHYLGPESGDGDLECKTDFVWIRDRAYRITFAHAPRRYNIGHFWAWPVALGESWELACRNRKGVIREAGGH